jgi:hypothetical protein
MCRLGLFTDVPLPTPQQASNEPMCEVAGQERGLGLVDWEKVGEMARRGEEGAVDEGKLP